MSTKAFEAFKYMYENPGDIQEIVPSGNEYYFKYKGHIFSVAKRVEDEERVTYLAFVYPHAEGRVADLVEYFDRGDPYDSVPLVRYGTDEAENSRFMQVLPQFHELLASKYLNLDDIFDDVMAQF